MSNQCKLIFDNKEGTIQLLLIPGLEFTKILLKEVCKKGFGKNNFFGIL